MCFNNDVRHKTRTIIMLKVIIIILIIIMLINIIIIIIIIILARKHYKFVFGYVGTFHVGVLAQ